MKPSCQAHREDRSARESAIRMEAYDYPLPPERIAQEPVTPRDASRLLVLDRVDGAIRHLLFRDLPEVLAPGDLLVLNDTRVFPARLAGRKQSGGRLEFLFLERDRSRGTWKTLCNGTRELRRGMKIDFGEGVAGEVGDRVGEITHLTFSEGVDVEDLLDRRGSLPVPPYIRRRTEDPRERMDRERYQTIFARRRGAVAAPTAGLHFTEELFRRLEARGIRTAFLTLYVGPGTFLPVRALDARRHRIHAERFHLPENTARAIAQTRELGFRVIAVGTTPARVLEHLVLRGELGASDGECDLYVLPGHVFRSVDALITNFHLPRSTLLLFVAAFAGRERILGAYREAMERSYRFYSYGDATLIL